MTDLHTHILPGVDDGAKTVEESLTLLRMERAQGIDTVALTPHYYPDRETLSAFLERRQAAWEQLNETVQQLPAQQQQELPALVLGAEVAYVPQLETMGDLRPLCLGSTKNMLLELPFYPWDKGMIHQLYVFLERVGVTPILAHIERYIPCQNKKFLDEILELGLPVQVGTEMLSKKLSPTMRLLRRGKAHLIASDCHDAQFRAPNLGQAMEQVAKRLGPERFEELAELADMLVCAQ